MYLKTLSIGNLRGIKSLSLDLDKEFNLVMGRNGSGKTVIVDAGFIATSQILSRVSDVSGATGELYGSDVIEGNIATIEAVCSIEGEDWLYHARESHQGGHHARKLVGEDMADTKRLLDGIDLIVTKIPSPRERFLNKSANWLQHYALSLSTHLVADQYGLDIGTFLHGYSNLYITGSKTTVDKGNTTIPITALSGGEKSILAIGMGILKDHLEINTVDKTKTRVVREAGRLQQSKGIVFIDDLGSHLDMWTQEQFLQDLRGLIPGCQIIATTYSPELVAKASVGKLHRIHMDGTPSVSMYRLVDLDEIQSYQEFWAWN